MKDFNANVSTGYTPSGFGKQVSEQLRPRDRLESSAYHHLSKVAELVSQVSPRAVAEIVHQLNLTRSTMQNVFTMGNGGSATTALHMTSDLSTATGELDSDPAIRAICLNSNISLFTAVANDHGYEKVFAWQLKYLLREGDVVIGISASGNSPNCVTGLKYARERGATTIGLLGFDGGIMKDLCDHHIHVVSNDYRLVEDVHLAICHAISYSLLNA